MSHVHGKDSLQSTSPTTVKETILGVVHRNICASTQCTLASVWRTLPEEQPNVQAFKLPQNEALAADIFVQK